VTAPALGKRLLVVDDDEGMREVLSEQLARAAMKALADDIYDAVLSDIRMPDMEGIALLRAVRAKDHDLPVVLLTGGPTMATAVEAVEGGALDYLIKPVPTRKLLETMERAVKLGALARLKREALDTVGFDRLTAARAELDLSFNRGLEGVWMACQPIVRAADGGLEAHEALVRTREAAFPHPGAFFSAAEQLGRLTDLGRTIRRRVADLLDAGALPADVFVNLHPQDLADDDLYGALAPLSRLDDLGAGYAGLNSLAVLSPDIVKIDMALVRDLDRDPVKRKLVGSIAGVCGELGIRVVAEGIEREDERVAAVDAGCDLLQGFLIGRPAAMVPG